jgi:hypothetical protein
MIDRQYSSYCFLASELSIEKKIKYSRQAANNQSMGFIINISHTHCITSLVKIAFDLKKIATELFYPLSFRERPKIKYIKSLLKSTHRKDVIFHHKKSRIFADCNVTDGIPYTDYLSRGDNKSFFPL